MPDPTPNTPTPVTPVTPIAVIPTPSTTDTAPLPSGNVSMADFDNILDGGKPSIVFPDARNADGKSIEIKAEASKPATPIDGQDPELEVAPVVPATDANKKPDSKIELAKPPVNPLEIQPVAPVQQQNQPDARDFAGLEEHEIPLFKKMNNASYNYMKPKLLELKSKATELTKAKEELATLRAGKQVLPESYYQNPEAYVLTPEVKELGQKVQLASSYANHWEAQLLAIEEGKDWHDLTRDAQGNIVIDPNPKPASAQSKLQVQKWYQGMNTKLGEFQGQINAIRESHVTRYTQESEKIKQDISKYFPVFDDPKNAELFEPQMKQVREMIPSSFRNNPLADALVKATVSAINFQQLYMQAAKGGQQQQQVATTVAAQQQQAGPTNRSINTGGNPTPAPKTITMADFDSVLGR